MNLNLIFLFILTMILGGLVWHLKKETNKYDNAFIIFNIIIFVALLSVVFVVDLITTWVGSSWLGILLAFLLPIIFALICLGLAFSANKKELFGEKKFQEWFKQNFKQITLRITILSIYFFILLSFLFLIFFNISGYDSSIYSASEIANSLTLLGIITTLLGMLPGLYEKLN
ncbi:MULTISPECIES: hypothetical protein [Bacillaceae]|uniref:hypothetical protein n=1 Tax=Bacillaceae TaxID=186817 RepID=UPI000BFC13C5|nr:MULTISPECIES: hypothetical protein [Bacillaceae]PGT89036.1 hypothetical protein COD11_05005 [Bacillus sp. AFS040349]UGB30668.1 hypothetical protein LPC09_23725 [Metabacillus sp. B2-18]